MKEHAVKKRKFDKIVLPKTHDHENLKITKKSLVDEAKLKLGLKGVISKITLYLKKLTV